ncbi:xanthine dehydrogenase family protein molybdopterin-binding subunit [Melittangium boletus]|uniref:xanthine dehydrogenase family protein molybdopterin-binding subunit n=1 Tax=Melittangium boletus TaxID=83453 RepID=UPI003DA3ACAF
MAQPTDGPATTRIDGIAKVTGRADYSADAVPEGLAHAVLVDATIARGKISRLDATEALKAPGVLAVLTHENAPALKKASAFPMGAAGHRRRPLQDARILYRGQHIAVVVATTREAARHAASLVRVTYQDEAPPEATLATGETKRMADLDFLSRAMSGDSHRGDPEAALATAPLVVDAVYTTARTYHAAMEPHATLAWWEGKDRLVVREGSQWVDGAQDTLAAWFGLKRDHVRLLSAFVGGGFGSRIAVYPHAALAALAAREVGRPVKLVLERAQVFLAVGNRPAIRQRVRLGADPSGKLTALVHESANETSRDSIYSEPGSRASVSTYTVPHYRAENSVAALDIPPPGWMRAPGEAPGSFAVESALDELAQKAGVDPLALRVLNHADADAHSGKPWSSRKLREAYALGAEVVGWSSRAAAPRSRREGHEWIGLGMATASYPSRQLPAEARVGVSRDGRVYVESRGVDIGQGTYTALAIVAAEVLGVAPAQVDVRLGDTRLPRSAMAGGSMLTRSLGTAVHGAATSLRDTLLDLARRTKGSPVHGRKRAALGVREGRVVALDAPSEGLDFAAIAAAWGDTPLAAFHRTHPTVLSRITGAMAFTSPAGIRTESAGDASIHSWGAQFAEVAVDEELGRIRVRRLVGVFDCGRILNPTAARSQMIGGMTMGLGMALMEGGHVDPRTAKLVNGDLGEYLVPVQADVPPIDVFFVGEPDPAAGPLGSKAVGEIGITGVAAAIANAVYNAIGHRARALPIDLRNS